MKSSKILLFPVIRLIVTLTITFNMPVVMAAELLKTPPPMKFEDPLPANIFVELGRIINPAVVNISTSATIHQNLRDPWMDMLEQFYGIPKNARPAPNKPEQLALGTGFIIREDGLIVTNAHVVRGAEGITVQLSEKSDKVYDAKLIGSDERADIALIKIKPDGKLPVAALGNSKDVRVGEWVAAFGNPFGHGHSLTKGIISSIGRELEEINKFPLIQTDASINPGNSGGPLVDAHGYVIGVNSAIDARAQGIGFAIPIDEVKRLIPDLESRGSVRKGYLGVGLGDMDPRASENYDLHGSVIVKVEPGTPAAKAKLRPYDIVTDFNGRKIKNSTELSDAVSDAPIGKKATLKVMRQEGSKFKSHDVDVIVQERPSQPRLAGRQPQVKTKGQKVPHNLGFSVSDLNDELRELLNLPEDISKPVVVEVQPNSVASFVGITAGDVILDVNKTEVNSAADVIKSLKAGENSMRLARGNRMIYITLNAK
jgi:serine protease Do